MGPCKHDCDAPEPALQPDGAHKISNWVITGLRCNPWNACSPMVCIFVDALYDGLSCACLCLPVLSRCAGVVPYPSINAPAHDEPSPRDMCYLQQQSLWGSGRIAGCGWARPQQRLAVGARRQQRPRPLGPEVSRTRRRRRHGAGWRRLPTAGHRKICMTSCSPQKVCRPPSLGQTQQRVANRRICSVSVQVAHI